MEMSPLILQVLPNGQVLARNCKVCGAVFALNLAGRERKCCSDACKRKSYAPKNRERARRRGQKIVVANQLYAKLISQTRKEPPRFDSLDIYCLVCGIKITLPGRSVTCSTPCAYERKLQKEKARYTGIKLRTPPLRSAKERRAFQRERYFAKYPDKRYLPRRGKRNRDREHERDMRRIAIYQTFKQLGLMPATTETDDGTR
jgi:predicted nucleic acid-binding Zn ribbon protein